MKNRIGIIGKGFVGSAAANGFSSNTGFDGELRIYDPLPEKSTHTLEEVVNYSDFCFISVPTPTDFSSGNIDLSIIYKCFADIANCSKNSETIFLLRSTVVPGTTSDLSAKFPNLRIVFNPEFLTQRSAYLDFINQARFIFGGNSKDTNEVANLFRQRFGKTIRVIETDYSSAELIKYMCNTFFATKVAFLNEYYLLAQKLDLNWDSIIEGFISDGRVGHSHVAVPGPDGKLGYGGACFPKDVTALLAFAKSIKIDMNTLEGSWQTNLLVRPEKDWEI